jgi:hypothetical protein
MGAMLAGSELAVHYSLSPDRGHRLALAAPSRWHDRGATSSSWIGRRQLAFVPCRASIVELGNGRLATYVEFAEDGWKEPGRKNPSFSFCVAWLLYAVMTASASSSLRWYQPLGRGSCRKMLGPYEGGSRQRRYRSFTLESRFASRYRQPT